MTEQNVAASQQLKSCRILIQGMNYWPEFTSTGRYTGELAAALSAAGATVEIVTAPPHYPGWFVRAPYRAWRYRREETDGIRIYRCPLFLKREMRGIWRLLAPVSFALSSTPVVIWRLLGRRPDVLLCVEPTLLAALLPAAVARLIGTRTVLHVQDLELDAAFGVGHLRGGGWLHRLAQGYDRLARRPFGRIVTISHAMRDRLMDKGIARDRIPIVRNWVDLSKIWPMTTPTPYRAELGIAAGTLVVHYAGNIGAKQALEVLLDAAERLSHDPDIVFVIAGDGPAKRGLIESYGHLPNVRFLDPQPEERLCEFLNLADLHALPQLAEAADLVLPSKLGGMLASGKPLVVTTHPDQELGVFLRDAAILVPPGDSAALSEAIQAFAATRHDPAADRRAVLTRQLSSEDRLADFVRIVAEQASAVPGRARG